MHHEKQNLHTVCPAEGPYGFMDIIFDDTPVTDVFKGCHSIFEVIIFFKF